jgi:hypothetical protein
MEDIPTRVSVLESDLNNFKIDIKQCLSEIRISLKEIAVSANKNSETFSEAIHSIRIGSTNEISSLKENFTAQIETLRAEKNKDILGMKITIAKYTGAISVAIWIASKLIHL